MPAGGSGLESIKQLMRWRDDATEAAWTNETGCSALHIACGLGRTDAVREMLADPVMAAHINTRIRKINKGDAGAKDKGQGAQIIKGQCKDMTPLAAAMVSGDPTLITLLIEAGAKTTQHEF